MKKESISMRVLSIIFVVTLLLTCLPFGFAFADSERPSNGGYEYFVDDSYVSADENVTYAEKSLSASALVYTTSVNSSSYKTYSKTISTGKPLSASMANAYFSVDVYGMYKSVAEANPKSTVTLESITVEQKAILAGGSNTVTVSTGYGAGALVVAEHAKPTTSVGESITVASSTVASSSVTEISDERTLSAVTEAEGVYFVWYVGQSSKVMYYYAPEVVLSFKVETTGESVHNNDASTAIGNKASFTAGGEDISIVKTTVPKTVTGEKIYLGTYNNGYIGSSNYGSTSGTIYTSVSTTEKNPRTNVELNSSYRKFSIPYLGSAYLNYDISGTLDGIKSALESNGVSNVNIDITSVDMYIKARMGYTGSYASSYAPYDQISVAVAPSWSGSNYPTSNFKSSGDYYQNYAYNVSVYFATSLTADQISSLNTTKAFTVKFACTDYYGYYSTISTEAYLWTLVEDYPVIAVNYSYTCDEVKETITDNTARSNLYAQYKFIGDNGDVFEKTKFLGELSGVGASASVTPYISGKVANLYNLTPGSDRLVNNSSVTVAEGEYVLKRAYVDSGSTGKISMTASEIANAYNVNYLSLTKESAPESVRVVFEYEKTNAPAPQEEFEIKSVTHTATEAALEFTVVTNSVDVNRVKAAFASAPNEYIKYASSYAVNGDGDYVWKITVEKPTETTQYVFDSRIASTGTYRKDYYTYTVEVEAPPASEFAFKDVSVVAENGKVVFTVVTSPSDINRIKIFDTANASSYVKLISTYTVNGDGNYVWTASIDAPDKTVKYGFDVRSSKTNKYLRQYYYASFDPSVAPQSNSSFKSVDAKVTDGILTLTVITEPASISRLKLMESSDLKTNLKLISSYTVTAGGDYVWVAQINAPTEKTSYTLDARSAETGLYLKEYYSFTVDPSECTEMSPEILSVSHNVVDEHFIFTVVTTPSDINRVKVCNSSGALIDYVSRCTTNKSGNYQWTISIPAVRGTNTFKFYMRSSVTGGYFSEGFSYSVTYNGPQVVNPDSPIESVSHSSSGGFVTFTVVTSAGSYNRLKVSLFNEINTALTYTNDYTVDGNGKYVWKLTVVQQQEDTAYSFDLRSSETSKYLKKYFDYTAPAGSSGENKSTIFKNISASVSGNQLTFTVETFKGFERIKVSLASNTSSYLKYTSKYTETADSYVWTMTIAAPAETTAYSFAAKSVGGSSYLAERYNYTYRVIHYPDESVWGSIDSNGVYTAMNGGYQLTLPGWVYYGVVDDCETVAASYTMPASCLFTKLYDVVDEQTFNSYTAQNFADILEMDVKSFRKTTVSDGYVCYVVGTDVYTTYVFQTNVNRYFLNFVQADDGVDVEVFSNAAMTDIVIYY